MNIASGPPRIPSYQTLRDLDPIERASIDLLRNWNDGEFGKARLWVDISAKVGPEAGCRILSGVQGVLANSGPDTLTDGHIAPPGTTLVCPHEVALAWIMRLASAGRVACACAVAAECFPGRRSAGLVDAAMMLADTLPALVQATDPGA